MPLEGTQAPLLWSVFIGWHTHLEITCFLAIKAGFRLPFLTVLQGDVCSLMSVQ